MNDAFANSDNAPVQLDLTGLKCPLPVLKARQQIGQMTAGSTLVVTADDPAAPLDFEHFCATNGHVLDGNTALGAVFTFTIIVGEHSKESSKA